jgi:choline dehydrogenase-like flavoprotein
MIADLESLSAPLDEECDVCIVGAGASGITLAIELSKSNKSIFLMESGGFNFEASTQDLYDGTMSGQPYGWTLLNSRLRYLGGSTNHYGGWLAPLDPIDFKKRPGIPYSGWPISYEEMLPYYYRGQKYFTTAEYPYSRTKEIFKLNKTLNFSKDDTEPVLYQQKHQRFGPFFKPEIN